MHCRKCGYGLWNLSAPFCPECAEPFGIRDFQFKLGTVAFACPYCAHLHLGQGARGLPCNHEKMACQGCGEVIRVGVMRVVVLADDDGGIGPIDADVLPWEDRQRLGWLRGWWMTCCMAMITPIRVATLIKLNARSDHAIRFAMVTYLIASGVHLVAGLVVAFVMFGLLRVDTINNNATMVTYMMGCTPALGGLALLGMPFLTLLVVSYPAQLFLHLTGESLGDANDTACCVLYGQGAGILIGIPVIGFFLMIVPLLWVMAATIAMVARVKRISVAQAAAACLWMPFLLSIVGLTLWAAARLGR